MKNVFEQVMLVDGSRRMRGDIIQKTFKVCIVLLFIASLVDLLFFFLVCMCM